MALFVFFLCFLCFPRGVAPLIYQYGETVIDTAREAGS